MIPSARHKTEPKRHLIKRAVSVALDDLKEKHAGFLLSAHAVKVNLLTPLVSVSLSLSLIDYVVRPSRKEIARMLNCSCYGNNQCLEQKLSKWSKNLLAFHSKELMSFLFL